MTRIARIAVTGLGGFVGHHFLEHVLTETDWYVTGTDSFRHKGKCDRVTEVLAAGPDTWRERVDVITHDLRAPFSPQSLARINGIDYLVAFASESHVDRSITDPVDFVSNNVSVCLNTLEAARTLKPKAVIWVSTDEVYGAVAADDLLGHDEWDPILPSNPYSASKAAQEAIAISYWRTYGVPVILVNCMNMIGERQDLEKFIPMVTARVLNGEEVTIHGTPEHIGTRHYLHARNLADGILFLLENTAPSSFPAHTFAACSRYLRDSYLVPEAADRPDRYNIATPDRIDNLTLANMIAEDLGRPLRYRLEDFHTTRPGHDPHYGLNPAKISDLGWRPPVSFRESLRKTVLWTKGHPEWAK